VFTVWKARAEIDAQHGQCGRDDKCVERDHEQPE
jgi:hypothetical protein